MRYLETLLVLFMKRAGSNINKFIISRSVYAYPEDDKVELLKINGLKTKTLLDVTS